MSLNELGKMFLDTAVSKGFSRGDESPLELANKLMLIVDEVSEAHEELRKDSDYTRVYYNGAKPEGFPMEIADILIRTLQLGAALGIDIDDVVSVKDAYNVTRPYMHGKKF